MAKKPAPKPKRPRGGRRRLGRAERALLERIVWYNARLHVTAYLEDRDPRHILDACIAFTEAGVPVPVEMHGNLVLLRGALDAKYGRRGAAFRDVLILRRLLIEYRGNIPLIVSAETVDDIAREHGMTRRAAITTISRLRKKLR
jgi:hypothetical protein